MFSKIISYFIEDALKLRKIIGKKNREALNWQVVWDFMPDIKYMKKLFVSRDP